MGGLSNVLFRDPAKRAAFLESRAGKTESQGKGLKDGSLGVIGKALETVARGKEDENKLAGKATQWTKKKKKMPGGTILSEEKLG